MYTGPMTTGRVGIFDSGLGGLTTLSVLRNKLPEYGYVYYADIKHAPYGALSHDTIYERTRAGVTFLKEQGCSIVILACNTASSEALRKLQKEFISERDTFRILGVLVPVAEEAATHTLHKKIGVMATAATIHSGAYDREILKCIPDAQITSVSCPLLVPLIEGGKTNTPACTSALSEYCEVLRRASVDTVILGCTHYGHIRDKIALHLPIHTHIVSEEDCIGEKTKLYLMRHSTFAAQLSIDTSIRIYSTKVSSEFDSFCVKLFSLHPELCPEV